LTTAPDLQSAPPTLFSDRLRERFEGLGVALATFESTGRSVPAGGCAWLERIVLESPAFAAAVRAHWPALGETQGGAIAVWPGVWLAPLPLQRRRRVASEKYQARVVAAILLGGEFIESDRFRLVCDCARQDYQATLARVEVGRLVSAAEAQRLALTLSWMQQDALEIDRRCGEIQSMSTQLGESYEELSLLSKLSTSMTVNQQPPQFLTDACGELKETLALRWMALLLTDDEPRLNDLAGKTFSAGPVQEPGRLLSLFQELLRLQPADGSPIVIDDTSAAPFANLPRLAGELLVVFMRREGKTFGVLIGGDKIDGSHISSVDSKLCNSLANSLSIFIENRMLYQDMAAMFMGTLHALTSSIDAKDSYTRGHSERVALMSRRLAAAAGLDPATVERVYISGLVHDVGKIGVPEAVLTKPGKLTAEEFGLIKLHPEIGARILRDIHQMQDLIPGVLYHHERWDGGGYPRGLKDTGIPLFGRLICLADSFDAMSSNRTYRRARSLDQVLAEVSRCAGTQFDPQLAALFVKLDFTEFQQMVEAHQHQSDNTKAVAIAS
jgi:HD-GYP domain-containing protein (c-di-GMP phosphodiesterase class II)